jgi:hypothetical protein
MSLLGKITKGKIKKPPRLLVHGEPGVGKSTFAAGFPNPLFIDAERRTEHLDVSRLEVDSWKEVLGVMGEILKSEELPCKTLVFDTTDRMERMMWEEICEEFGKSNIEDFGFGKGYEIAAKRWIRFVKGIEAIRDRGMYIVLITHSVTRNFKNPLGDDWHKYLVDMNQKAFNILKAGVDGVGFARFDDQVHEEKGSNKKRGVYTGRRQLVFRHDPGFESKNGIGLPDKCELSFEAIKEFY